MNIKENFLKIKNNALSVEDHIQKNDYCIQLDELISKTKQMLENPQIVEELNENIFWLNKSNDDDYKYFCVLIECLMTYLDEVENENLQEDALKIIEIISTLRIKELSMIKSSFIIRLLEKIILFEENRILSIILRLSENQYYEKIAYTGPMDRSTTIDRIDIMVNAKAIKSKIITNLSEQLFREQLEYLNSLDLNAI